MKADFEKGMKVCGHCKMELPISEFSKNRSANDGLCNECKACRCRALLKYRKTEVGQKRRKRERDKYFNTFGRTQKRGMGNIVKRDYELNNEQLERRSRTRKNNKSKNRAPCHGLLIWYDGTLENLTPEEYDRIYNREYERQRSCAIRGYVGRTEPSEHFLIDFDLKKMLEDNVYCCSGKHRRYITKWWEGEIRHWNVKDGIWKETIDKQNMV